MPSPYAEAAVNNALRVGRAILKFISRNNVGDTGSHECGYYLPKNAWKLFTSSPPTKGANAEHEVTVLWQDGRETRSRCKWYGKGTRSEYRLTCFGRDFPFLDRDNVGSLLVIVPESHDRYLAWVLDFDEDIEAVQVGLGVEILDTCAVYERGQVPPEETEDECLDRKAREFVAKLDDFPTSVILSDAARAAVAECLDGILSKSADRQLLEWVAAEYHLFRMLERKVCSPLVTEVFKDIDQFLTTAQSILQRRKSRAGLSLQNHVGHILEAAGIPFERDMPLPGKPDIVIPGMAAYEDPA